MTIKITTPNGGSDSLDFGCAQTAIVATVTGTEVSSGEGKLELKTTTGGTSATKMTIAANGTVTLATPLPAASGGTGGTGGGGGITLGTVAATTSGTSIDFTGIPSGVKRVVVMFNGVSTNGGAKLRLQIGTSGGLQTSGYLSVSSYMDGGAFHDTAGFGMYSDNVGDFKHGHVTLNLLNASDGTWCLSGMTCWTPRAYLQPSAGVKILSGTLDRVRLTTANGTDAFDAGSMNISWES
jgi:hypothetical protein